MYSPVFHIVKDFIVRHSQTRLKPVLKLWYDSGYFFLLQLIKRTSAIEVAFGTGSYHFSKPLYGHSDIDTIIVFRPEYTKFSKEVRRFKSAYQKLRLCFPFLGNWQEQEQNLVFLGECIKSETLPSGLRFRIACKRLKRLAGSEDRVQELYGSNPLVVTSCFEELAQLVQYLYLRSFATLERKLFWSRLYYRLSLIADLLGYPLDELAYAEDDQCADYFTKIDIAQQRERFEGAVAKLYSQFLEVSQFPKTVVAQSLVVPADENSELISWCSAKELLWLRNPPILSDCPEFLFFDLGCKVAVYEETRDGFLDTRELISDFDQQASLDEVCIVVSQCFYYILRKERSGYSIVALPIPRFPTAYKYLVGKELPISKELFDELEIVRERKWSIQAEDYQSAANWVERYPFPCVYVEDEAKTCRDMFYLWSVWLSVYDNVSLCSKQEIVSYLRSRFPNIEKFFDVLSNFATRGASIDNKNIYRDLHLFTAQLIRRVDKIELLSNATNLECSVAIITRNRASFLDKALASIVAQVRAAEEVVIIDNGSSDKTLEIVEKYRKLLPIVCETHPFPSVTKARNKAIRLASKEVICFVDDDCVMDPAWLASVERAFLRGDNIGIVGGAIRHQCVDEQLALDHYYRIFHHSLGSVEK